MKIVNICLCAPYNCGWGYQDNLISKYQKINGNDVTVVTTKFINDIKSEGYLEVDSEVEYDNDVKVIRLNHFINKKVSSYFRLYKGLYKTLCDENPDFIFIHGCQFLDIYKVCKYLKKHKNVYVCVDNHADYTNSAKTIFVKFIHKALWKQTAKAIDKYASVFYGVIPIRCDFLNEMYDISREKIKLLVMGADDEKVEKSKKCILESKKKVGLNGVNFVVVTGGKVDLHKKGIINLMKVVNKLSDEYPNLKLLVFGSVVDELKDSFDKQISDKVLYLGWKNQDEIYDILCMADLAIYPGRHSVIWEQTVGCGIPSIFLELPNTKHVDINGNCLFLKNESEDELKKVLCKVLDNENLYNGMIEKSIIASNKFSYKQIAKKSIDDCINESQKSKNF